MKKTVLSLIPILLLLIVPVNALATLITYAGSGYFTYTTLTGQTNTYNISTAMQISDQPKDWYTGQPILINQILANHHQYYFDIANWFMNVSGVGNYSGNSGVIYNEIIYDPPLVGVADAMWGLSGPFSGQAWLGPWQNIGVLPSQFYLSTGDFDQTLFPNVTDMATWGGYITLSAVPEPSSLLLLGSGFAGFTWFITRRKKK